ncbi:hypothetical protein ABPG73_021869 [Tetrahymena malaccensis]
MLTFITFFIKKKLFFSAFYSPVCSQRNSLVQFYSISQQNYQQNNQIDTIKQFFNRPASAILEKLNQKMLGSISKSHRDSVYKINNSIANYFSKFYSIEISMNKIVLLARKQLFRNYTTKMTVIKEDKRD